MGSGRALLTLFASLAICGELRAGPCPRAEPRDVASALAGLSAESASERAAAERELARLLVIADAPLVAAAAQRGSTEIRARIASALKSDARHLALAAELAASGDTNVSITGCDAIAGQAAAWLETSDQEPLPVSTFEREARGAFSGYWRLDLSRGELEPTLDQIARIVEGRRSDRPTALPPAIVLDPDFALRAARTRLRTPAPGEYVFGGFAELVYAAALSRGAELDVYGWSEGRTWFVVRAKDTPSGRGAQSLLLSWILAVAKPASPGGAHAAARALASSGWTAAIEWLDLRWRDQQDPAALDGVVLAASRGSVGASLLRSGGAQDLLERADRALASAGNANDEAKETARALLAIGSIGSAAWSSGFSALPARSRALRCALVAGSRACPADLAALLQARLLVEDTSPDERCTILRALGALGPPRGTELAIPGLDAALEWAVQHAAGPAFLYSLRAIGGREPEAWKSARGSSPRVQSALLADALENGSDAAGPRLASLLTQTGGEEAVLTLLQRQSLSLPAARLRAALISARAAVAGAETITRLMVCTGLDTPEEGRTLGEEVFAKADWNAADWRVAGARVARAGGALDRWPRKEETPDENYTVFLARLESVRDRLQAAQSAAKGTPVPNELDGMAADWVRGCECVLWSLHARQCEPGAREFLRRLRVLFQRVQHPFFRELSAGRFPPPSPAVLIEVESREPWIGF